MSFHKLPSIVGLICAVGLLLGGVLTTAAQSPAASSTPLPSETPFPTETMTATPTPQGELLVLQITSGADDVNESSGKFDATQLGLWAGNGGATNGQYLGLRFTKVPIPPGSIIHAAHLEIYTPVDQWITLSYDIFAEASDNSEAFTAANPPSKRELTNAAADHESNDPWLGKSIYPLDEMGAVIQEVVSRPGWQIGNSLSVIAVGTEAGGEFGRKYFIAFEGDPKQAVRLVIDITAGKIPPTPTQTSTPEPTATLPPTLTPAATATTDPCGTVSLPSRLKVGQIGQVIINASAPTTPVNIRKAPTVDAERIGRLAPGVSFTVIDGPTCANNVAWFKVRYGDNNLEGWLAEGQNSLYFVEPAK